MMHALGRGKRRQVTRAVPQVLGVDDAEPERAIARRARARARVGGTSTAARSPRNATSATRSRSLPLPWCFSSWLFGRGTMSDSRPGGCCCCGGIVFSLVAIGILRQAG